MKNAMEKIRNLTYGVEIEYTGVGRKRIAEVIAAAVGGTATYAGTHLSNWVVRMPDGREWQIETDGSVTGSGYGRDGGCGGEVVTPILTYADIEMLQNVVRAMRSAGAKTDASCGGHIHVGAADMTARQVQNLVKVFYRQEELIYKACGVQESRLARYTRRDDYAKEVAELRNPTLADIADCFYRRYGDRYSHYSSSRYRALNLHNLWNGSKHTVEFRFFEGTMHAGHLRRNILLALTLVAFAKEAKAASGLNQRAYDERSAKYDLRVFLLRLGWIGEEFKNPRKHLLANMPGSAAWKDGAAHGRRVAG